MILKHFSGISVYLTDLMNNTQQWRNCKGKTLQLWVILSRRGSKLTPHIKGQHKFLLITAF